MSCSFLARFACAFSIFLIGELPAKAAATDPASFVDPMIGTNGHGHTFPGATAPFGMVQLSPDTGIEGWDWCSGYHYSDSSIIGFSHTHLSGTGCADLGNILFVPQTGEIKWQPGSKEKPSDGYRATFRHEDETAKAGYYSVKLQRPNIFVELTATERAGVHRYTFPTGQPGSVLIDLGHRIGKDKDAKFAGQITQESPTIVSGWQHTDGWSSDKTYYFVAEFSQPIVNHAFRVAGAPVQSTQAKGANVQGAFSFAIKSDQPLTIRVGLSAVSVEKAKANLAAEVGNRSFEEVRADAWKKWNNALGRIEVESPSLSSKRTFYTALYHTMIAPNLYNDVDGAYVGIDRKVHSNPGFNYYSTMSLWDTFRAANPLYTLVEPERVNDFVRSMLTHYDQNPRHELPVWPLCANETGCMIGYHSVPVIVDAWFKGYRDFDPSHALKAMKDSSNAREGNQSYREKGFAPSEKRDDQGTSRTLEYAYDDWCIAQLAGAIGAQEDEKNYRTRSENFRNVYDPAVGLMRGKKSDGKWAEPFDATKVDFNSFTEANSWQYSFCVMQDVPALIKLMGGPQSFASKLDTMWTIQNVKSDVSDVTGLIGQYAQGNEPSHHVAYLYDWAGEPWKTQKWVREITDTLYSDKPDGLCGNEDCGQMSAWYVFSALGIYPVNPASGIYMIGSPTFPKATLTVGANRKTFSIEAQNSSSKNIYIQQASLNGKPLDRAWVTHRELSAGGSLVFVMGPNPNKKWAASSLTLSTGY